MIGFAVEMEADTRKNAADLVVRCLSGEVVTSLVLSPSYMDPRYAERV